MISRILLADLCYEKNSLSQYEFVHPIREAMEKFGFPCKICHYTEIEEDVLESSDKVILCGTALKDNAYMKQIKAFYWLKDLKKPILGICAGMQVISGFFGGSIVQHPAIGLNRIEITGSSPLLGEPRKIEGYHLHNYAATLPEGFLWLAGKLDFPEAFQHRTLPIYGIMFHPEVRNRWILERFANL
ncbi:MAG TPA: gamma-glutamyl-gamma-aminobutyrate hydrolase family protein [Methanothrix sp.]|jgi:GMP synthase (glutamine-hydrolysing)